MRPSAITPVAATYEVEIFGRSVEFSEYFLGMSPYLYGEAEHEVYYIFLHTTVDLAIHFDQFHPNPKYLKQILESKSDRYTHDILQQLRKHFPYRWMENLKLECFGLTSKSNSIQTEVEAHSTYLPLFS